MARGKFHFKPLTCKLLLEKERLKSINPICKISVGSHSRCTDPGRNLEEYLSWNQELILDRTTETTIHIEILNRLTDKDKTSFECIGCGELFFDPTLGGQNFLSEWIPLKDKTGHKIGSILIELTYIPKTSNEKEKVEKLEYLDIHSDLAKLSSLSGNPLGDANDLLMKVPEDMKNDSLLNKEDFLTAPEEEFE